MAWQSMHGISSDEDIWFSPKLAHLHLVPAREEGGVGSVHTGIIARSKKSREAAEDVMSTREPLCMKTWASQTT